MAEIVTYKCPNCGSDIPFDSTSGYLKCRHCNTSYNIEDLKAYDVENNIEADSFEWSDNDLEHIDTPESITYTCPNCGGAVIGDKNMAASTCPYCGNALIVSKQFEGMLKPDLVVPFAYSKEEAKKAYENHLKNKTLLPNDFSINNIIENIKGLYVPYWLFSCEANCKARFHATRKRVYTSGDYEITEDSHYLVYRDATGRFENVPVDASSKLEDNLLDSLEPYDFSKGKDFNTAYLSGYFADKYDQNKDEVISKANTRIKNSMDAVLSSTVIGYTTVFKESSSIRFHDGKSKYALLPVYIFSSKYNGKIYQFAMNGQTGKFVGDLPMDNKKAFQLFLLVFVISFIVITILAFLVMGGM